VRRTLGHNSFILARVIAAQEHCAKLATKAEQEKLKKEARKQERMLRRKGRLKKRRHVL
jgi:uncharacterized protein (DUF924 family)